MHMYFHLRTVHLFYDLMCRNFYYMYRYIYCKATVLWHCQDTEVQYPENRTPEVSILILHVVLFVVLEYVERHKSVSTTVLLLLLLRTR